jgi:hypothetical protein
LSIESRRFIRGFKKFKEAAMVKVCDCFPELKAVTDARERRYRAHPDKPAPEGRAATSRSR